MKVKMLLLIVPLLLLCMLPGCWDYNEYEDLALVFAMGVDMDKQTGQVTVTLQYIIPGGSSREGGGDGAKGALPKVAIKTASGLTMADAVQKIQQSVGKRLFYGYMDIEVVGEAAAKNIMEDIMGMNDRTTSIRNTARLVIASGKAADALSIEETDISVPAAAHIRKLVDKTNSTGNAFPVIIEDFIEYMHIGGLEPIAPRLSTTVSGKKDGKSGGSAGESQGLDGGGNLKEGYHTIDGMAAFKGGEFAGWLDGIESRGLAWITGKSMTPYLSFKTSEDANTKGIMFFRVTNSKGRIKVTLDNGKPVINVSVYAEADLRKYAKTMEPEILTPDVIKMIQRDIESTIHSEIEAALEKGQKELKTDIFGFGFAFYRQYPKLWHSMYEQKWEEVFPDVTVDIKVKAKVISTGTSIMKFFIR